MFFQWWYFWVLACVFFLGNLNFLFGQCCPYRNKTLERFVLCCVWTWCRCSFRYILVLGSTTMIYYTILQVYCTWVHPIQCIFTIAFITLYHSEWIYHFRSYHLPALWVCSLRATGLSWVVTNLCFWCMWKMSRRASWNHVYTVNQEPYCPVEECISQQISASDVSMFQIPSSPLKRGEKGPKIVEWRLED